MFIFHSIVLTLFNAWSVKVQNSTTTEMELLFFCCSTESHENPFLADGELSKKAEYIIRHSTISRTEIRISDPDLHKNIVSASPEEVIVSESTPLNAAPPPSNDPKENGQLEKAVKAKPVEAEVGKANASQPEPQQAEQVKLKDNKKCKCCVVQ